MEAKAILLYCYTVKSYIVSDPTSSHRSFSATTVLYTEAGVVLCARGDACACAWNTCSDSGPEAPAIVKAEDGGGSVRRREWDGEFARTGEDVDEISECDAGADEEQSSREELRSQAKHQHLKQPQRERQPRKCTPAGR